MLLNKHKCKSVMLLQSDLAGIDNKEFSIDTIIPHMTNIGLMENAGAFPHAIAI